MGAGGGFAEAHAFSLESTLGPAPKLLALNPRVLESVSRAGPQPEELWPLWGRTAEVLVRLEFQPLLGWVARHAAKIPASLTEWCGYWSSASLSLSLDFLHSLQSLFFFLSIFFSSCLSCVFSQNSYGNGYFPAPSPIPLSVRFPVLQTRFESRPRAGGKQSLRGLLAASKDLGHPVPPSLPSLTPALGNSWQVNARQPALKREPLQEGDRIS